MVQILQIELSITSNTTRSQIQINVAGHLQDMLYNSKTQLIQFTDRQSS